MMQAVRVVDDTGKIALEEVAQPSAREGHCLIRIKAAALNRRDQWIREGLYPGIKAGVTLGSDGCGVVEEGPADWKGKDVIINPSLNWGDRPEAQGPDYSILGLPVNGTLASYLLIPTSQVYSKPAYLSASEAAALPLASLTAYRACVTKGAIAKGNKVLVTGAGGGVSQFALPIAKALGAHVYVTSSSEDKIRKSIELGAEGGFNYRDDGWWKQALKEVGTFDAVIDGAGGDSIDDYLKIMTAGGRIVIYGATAGKPKELDVRRLFWGQVAIHGSTMGSPDEFEAMLQLYQQHEIRPAIDRTYDIADYEQAFDRFKESDHFGKIIVDLS